MRKNSNQFKLLCETSLHCDFVISQRMGLIRFRYTDISSSTNRNSIIDKVTKAKAYYSHVTVLIEDDREDGLNKTRTKYYDSVLASLTQSTYVLFSKHKSM